ncbi:unnamed protein product [Tuber melanosporum]|uniref:(Perigord truffle) hypothetical protein n=1 Tax=Tuber melanosporum (strain Mel28) TaxID=656061 RepID=D5GDZ1_TUBMM|nr:uncharacterized protein GSTUM_00001109001 [Tuber melanosporum]CAZ82734.1 unnamed protein product [Tuber melanosporum]
MSHYLCHNIRHRYCLVEITLGVSRILMILSRRFSPTFWPKKISHFFFPPAILVSFVFHQLTTIHRISLQR